MKQEKSKQCRDVTMLNCTALFDKKISLLSLFHTATQWRCEATPVRNKCKYNHGGYALHRVGVGDSMKMCALGKGGQEVGLKSVGVCRSQQGLQSISKCPEGLHFLLVEDKELTLVLLLFIVGIIRPLVSSSQCLDLLLFNFNLSLIAWHCITTSCLCELTFRH